LVNQTNIANVDDKKEEEQGKKDKKDKKDKKEKKDKDKKKNKSKEKGAKSLIQGWALVDNTQNEVRT
jgi:hypothetical protein